VDDNSQHEPPTSGSEPQSADAGANGHPPQPTPDELRKRLDELERELSRTRAERDEFKASTYELLGKVFPFVPPTAEEIHDMLYGPRGQPIIEIVEEYERKLEADGPVGS
jgi:hypothetical protein